MHPKQREDSLQYSLDHSLDPQIQVFLLPLSLFSMSSYFLQLCNLTESETPKIVKKKQLFNFLQNKQKNKLMFSDSTRRCHEVIIT